VPPSRCISVSLAVVSTYAERPQLSQELVEKLSKAQGAELAHAVAVIGLGGTGKTQLVLRYIQRHQEQYDTVLWLDVQSVETVRSSFERCCRALGLPVEATLSDGPLQDVAPVHAVLSWLRDRSEDTTHTRWLVIMDNADDPSWVSSIVPKGKAGTVILTSQDARVLRLLGGRTLKVNVDAMEPKEAICVLSEHFKDFVYRDEARECEELIEEVAGVLDRLALAMDLAGARISANVENGIDLRAALRQYLADYRQNRDRLLQDDQFASVGPYKKTVWTAWETSLASLRKLEQSEANVYPIHLLYFMILLDRSRAEEELFRLASSGFERVCYHLDIKVPAWMEQILTKRKDGKWDDFSYRNTVNLLMRYGLVRPTAQPWKGVTMHSLVRWRASVEMHREQYWHLYLAFVAAVCDDVAKVTGYIPFRQHIKVRLPKKDSVLGVASSIEPEGLRSVWTLVGNVLQSTGRWGPSEQILLNAVVWHSRVLGTEHPDNPSTETDLASMHLEQQLKNVEQTFIEGIERTARLHGEEDPEKLMLTAFLTYTREISTATKLQPR
jgi:hypothetical protein